MAGRNRLTHETSPYLRQHADNPVHWWPWCDEAFEEARRRDVPVFLSVGYSSCHWCHVMAHESFEDPATAELVNARFVNVKVDREERPDVDAVYLEAVQAMTGQGGWPMTVFLAPDGRPFFGGTYFPRTGRPGLPSFTDVCRAVDEAWRTRRTDILDQADRLTEAVRAATFAAGGGALPDAGALAAAAASIGESFDPGWGGFGRAPKFPNALVLELLLRVHHRTGDERLLTMVTTSLDGMAAGGMHDHLGGGFARYSVDERWLVPHFEKMLYDQALLARVYLHAWQVTGEPRYRRVLDDTVGYVLHELTSPGGGWCSAEDADSEGEEGRYYVWRPDEVRAACGADADAAIDWWGVTDEGDFEGASVLHRPVGADLGGPAPVERARAALLAARGQRVRPGLDDKVLTEWNALFLATLAEAAAATGTRAWRHAAVAGGELLLRELRRPDGRWLRSWQPDTGGRHLAYAADHAALVDAFTRLAELTGEARWLAEARSVADALLELFADPDGPALFTTGHDAEALVARRHDVLDGATPSANGTAAFALARLSSLTGHQRYLDVATGIVGMLAEPAARHPSALAHLLAAADLLAGPTTEIVVAGDRADLVAAAQRRYAPRSVLAWGERHDSPLWEGRADGHAYVCESFACRRPVDTVEGLVRQLG